MLVKDVFASIISIEMPVFAKENAVSMQNGTKKFKAAYFAGIRKRTHTEVLYARSHRQTSVG